MGSHRAQEIAVRLIAGLGLLAWPAHAQEAEQAIARLKEAAMTDENVFAVLMDAARVCSRQQVTEAFFEVGGQYRRNV